MSAEECAEVDIPYRVHTGTLDFTLTGLFCDSNIQIRPFLRLLENSTASTEAEKP